MADSAPPRRVDRSVGPSRLVSALVRCFLRNRCCGSSSQSSSLLRSKIFSQGCAQPGRIDAFLLPWRPLLTSLSLASISQLTPASNLICSASPGLKRSRFAFRRSSASGRELSIRLRTSFRA